MKRILIVEDDPHITLGLEELLHGDGFDVSHCRRGDNALAATQAFRPHLIILDVMLPGINGIDVCRELRRRGLRQPVLLLTAKGQEQDKVIGLDSGADDYVTKPFGVRELLARVRALLRRFDADAPNATTEEPTFRIGSCEIDSRTYELHRGRTVESLTDRELRLLRLFHQCRGEVLSRDRLLSEVWGHGYFGTTRTLDQVIVQLRRKLGDSGDAPRHLITVHGIGYKLAK